MTDLSPYQQVLAELDPRVRASIEAEMRTVLAARSDATVEIFPPGFVFYTVPGADLLLVTPHNGSITPEGIPFIIPEDVRHTEEDLLSGELYSGIILKHGGTWATTHISRYFVDLNRVEEQAVLRYQSPSGHPHNCHPFYGMQHEIEKARDYHQRFMEQLFSRITEETILFHGHTMRREVNPGEIRPEICLLGPEEENGMREIADLFRTAGFNPVRHNDPFPYQLGGLGVMFLERVRRHGIGLETRKDLFQKEDEFTASTQLPETRDRVQNVVDKFLEGHLTPRRSMR